MEEVAASEVAPVLDAPLRTVQYWLKTGQLDGYQKITGRWMVSVGSVRTFIERRARDGGRAEKRFDAFVEQKFRVEGGQQ